MDRSYPYSRRLASRARLQKRVVIVLGACMLGSAAMFMMNWNPGPVAASATQLALADTGSVGGAVQRGARRIYPYSVIPGGVSGQAELARVVRTDRVVAAHYATFDVSKAHAVKVDKPRAVHVSYRKDGKVYWTAHKVMLAQGETLLSDGRNEMRARCANRISDVAQYPVEAHQPAMDELDQAVDVEEGEQYALGPDGLPVSTGESGGGLRQVGRFSLGGGGAGMKAAPASAAADSLLSSKSSSMGDNASLAAMGMSGSSSSITSRPRPASQSGRTPDTATGADGSGSAGSQPVTGGSPIPESIGGGSGGTADPVGTAPVLDTGTSLPPASTPQLPGTPGSNPDSTPLPGTFPGTNPLPVSTPDPVQVPAPVPGGQQSGGGTEQVPELPQPPLPPPGTGPLFPQPGPTTEPFIPKPELTLPPPPASNADQDKQADLPEPGSIWLIGGALAGLLVVRRLRRRGARKLSQES